MLLLSVVAFSLGVQSYVRAAPVALILRQANDANPILYNGRAPNNLTQDDIEQSNGPYLSAVKGSDTASHYFQLLGNSFAATPLFDPTQEQAVRVIIDNSSVFVPGGDPANSQFGFRRSELIAQQNKADDRTKFNALIESGTTAFHFSVQSDANAPLNFAHEYQAMFIEPNDGRHIFDLQTGTPFNQTVSDADARMLRIRAHDQSTLFMTPFDDATWHNFAVVVDSDKLTLQVFYSKNEDPLTAVTDVKENTGVGTGPTAQGDWHCISLLKLPLINPADSPKDQGDVAHHGLQEGSTEGLIYSGVFVENPQNGITAGKGKTVPIGY